MKVLVAVASKHGATTAIGTTVAEVLVERGFDVEMSTDLESVDDLQLYDAVVLGSAVYAGRWLKPARAFVDRFEQELAKRPVWLFSSGPVGDPPMPNEDPADVPELVARTGARDHHVFPGALDRGQLGFGERTVVRALRVSDGDHRDQRAITQWAATIAADLRSLAETRTRR